MAGTPENGAGAPQATPDEVTGQTRQAPAGATAEAAMPAADEAPTLAPTVVAAPPAGTPPAPPAAPGQSVRRPWWHYAVGAAAAAAILIGVFLGGVAVGKNSGPDFRRDVAFGQMMPGYGQNGGQTPYGQGGQGWGDNGTSPHGWGRQGQGHPDWDQDGDQWGDQQGRHYGPQTSPSPTATRQTQ